MNKKPLSLIDVCPEDGEFTLSTGETFSIRKFSLADHAWLSSTFGEGDALKRAFETPLQMLRIAFHQLPIEDQKKFQPVQMETCDEETGEILTEQVGGWRLFARRVPNSGKDLEAVATALTKALVGSAPIADAQEFAENAGDSSKKKKGGMPLTGQKSLTSSPQSTATDTPTFA